MKYFTPFFHKPAQKSVSTHCFHNLVFERQLMREYLSFCSCISFCTGLDLLGGRKRLQITDSLLRISQSWTVRCECLCPAEILLGIWQRLQVCWLIMKQQDSRRFRSTVHSHANHSYTTGRTLRHCGPG